MFKFIKEFFKNVLIYTLITAIIELTTGGQLQDLMSLQRVFFILFMGVFMTALLPHFAKKSAVAEKGAYHA